MILPPRIRPGDTVAIVSPSAPAVSLFPHRVERGVAFLRSLGLEVRLMPNAPAMDGWVAGSAQQRADDINGAFADDSVGIVLAALGGNHSNQVAPLLDYELIASHPKVFQGFSDITVLHWAIHKHTDLVTFYGPSPVANLAEYPEVFAYTSRSLRAAWFSDGPITYEPSDEWTDEFLDWEARKDLERPRERRDNEGWVVVRDGSAEGSLYGGCLETICWHLKGSDHWMDLDGGILFLETSEEAPSPAHVDGYLTDLEQLGVFDQVRGLLVGRPAFYSAESVAVLHEVLANRTEASGIPVLTNFDCGHTDPFATLALGAPFRLDATAPRLTTIGPVTR